MSVAQPVFGLEPIDNLHVALGVEAVCGEIEPLLNGPAISLLDARKIRCGALELSVGRHDWGRHSRLGHGRDSSDRHDGRQARACTPLLFVRASTETRGYDVGMKTDEATLRRVYRMQFAQVYPLYVAKIERKGRTKAELDEVIEWFTGFDEAARDAHVAAATSFEDFFASANITSRAPLITGVVCGVRVEDVEDPVLKNVRYLDKLVDELAKGKAMEKILR